MDAMRSTVSVGGQGAGTVVKSGERTLILTASHLLPLDLIYVTAFQYGLQGRITSIERSPAQVIWRDQAHDLALLEAFFDKPPPSVSMGNAWALVGCPGGLIPYMTQGRLGGWRGLSGGYDGGTTFGFSGGGVYDEHWKLVGVMQHLSAPRGVRFHLDGRFMPIYRPQALRRAG
jgi:hypothetical protein